MGNAYLQWDEKTITDFPEENVNSLYNQGYVFTRVKKGLMQQTRSVRIDLSQFALSSENRRILRKTEGIEMIATPIPFFKYHWSIGKMAKDFYDTKFGEGTFSANKVRELLTHAEHTNFNVLLVYDSTLSSRRSRLSRETRDLSYTEASKDSSPLSGVRNDIYLGYCITLQTNELIHYSYPFYDRQKSPPDMGLGMMIRALLRAKEQGKKYIYLGSAQRPSDTYKLQFAGVEWWNGERWRTDLNELKSLLQSKI